MRKGEDWERTNQEFREGTFSGPSMFGLARSSSFWQRYDHTNECVCNKTISPMPVSTRDYYEDILRGHILKVAFMGMW